MIVLGIDPGFTYTGVVGLTEDGGELVGAMAFPSEKGVSTEVRAVRLARDAFYHAWGLQRGHGGVAAFCIEENVSAGHGNSATTMMQRELIGILCAMAVEHGWPVKRINNGTAKKVLTGNGHAHKPEMVAAARAKFGVPSWRYMGAGCGERRPDGQPAMDERAEAIADAIGVALAGVVKGADK